MLCTVTATLLHYFLLCVFAWMLCHGAIFYFLIIKAELRAKLQPKMKWFYALGWGKTTFLLCVPECLSWLSWINVIHYFPFSISFVSGFPLPMVAASLAVTLTGTKPRAVDNCWLTVEYGIIYWTFVGPVALVVLVSILRFNKLTLVLHASVLLLIMNFVIPLSKH